MSKRVYTSGLIAEEVEQEDPYYLNVAEEVKHLTGEVGLNRRELEVWRSRNGGVGDTSQSQWLRQLAGRRWASGGVIDQALHGVKLKWRRGAEAWAAGAWGGLKNEDRDAVLDMAGLGVVRRATEEEEAQLPPLMAFSVAKRDGGRRMILDARPVNRRIWGMGHTTMPSLRRLEEVDKPVEAFCVDIKKAYWSLPMHGHDQPALSFQWEEARWIMQRLAMGLQVAAGVFQRFMETVLNPLRWALPEIMLFIFQDDVGMLRPSWMKQERWDHAVKLLLDLLSAAGLVLAADKTMKGSRVKHLGFILDFEEGTVTMEESKLKDMQDMIWRARRRGLSVGTAMSLIGKLGAGALVDPGNTLMLGGVKRLVWAAWNRMGKRARMPQAAALLDVAQQRLEALKAGKLEMGRRSRRTGVEVQTDASRWGGGFVWWANVSSTMRGSQKRGVGAWAWGQPEGSLTIAVLEALAVLRALLSVQWSKMERGNRKVLLWVDNRVVVSVLRKGHGGGAQMVPVLAAIMDICVREDLVLDVRWIPTSLNGLADAASRGAGVTKVEEMWARMREDDRVWSSLVAERATKAWAPSASWDLEEGEVEEILRAFGLKKQDISTECFGPMPWETARFPGAVRRGRLLDWDRSKHPEGVELLDPDHPWAQDSGLCWVFPPVHLVQRVVDKLQAKRRRGLGVGRHLVALPVDRNKFGDVANLEGLAIGGTVLVLGRRLLSLSGRKRPFPVSVFIV